MKPPKPFAAASLRRRRPWPSACGISCKQKSAQLNKAPRAAKAAFVIACIRPASPCYGEKGKKSGDLSRRAPLFEIERTAQGGEKNFFAALIIIVTFSLQPPTIYMKPSFRHSFTKEIKTGLFSKSADNGTIEMERRFRALPIKACCAGSAHGRGKI